MVLVFTVFLYTAALQVKTQPKWQLKIADKLICKPDASKLTADVDVQDFEASDSFDFYPHHIENSPDSDFEASDKSDFHPDQSENESDSDFEASDNYNFHPDQSKTYPILILGQVTIVLFTQIKVRIHPILTLRQVIVLIFALMKVRVHSILILRQNDNSDFLPRPKWEFIPYCWLAVTS